VGVDDDVDVDVEVGGDVGVDVGDAGYAGAGVDGDIMCSVGEAVCGCVHEDIDGGCVCR